MDERTFRMGSVRPFIVFFSLIMTMTAVRAQNPIEDAIKQLTSDNVKGYMQPFVNSFGADLNSGWYHSASIGTLGMTFRIDFTAMGTLIGDAEKKYNAISPFDGSLVETATLYGERGAVLEPIPGVQYQFQNGQVETKIVPFMVPQLTVGDIYGTQAVIRYVPIPEVNKIPKVSLFGLGVRHNVSQYIPACPVDLAGSIFWQSLTIGNLMESKTFAFGAQVSKTFAVITLYGGLQYESSTLDLSYIYSGQIPGVTVPETKVSLSLDSDNSMRGTAGFDISLAILHIFADVNVGKSTTVSAGVGFGF